MNQLAKVKTPVSLLWVAVSVPDQPTYWARTSRLLASCSLSEHDHTLELLKAGRTIAYQASGLSIQCVPMPVRDRKRLDHLLSFEDGGFRLATFRQNTALFYRGEQDYYSMNEMAERGFWPRAGIALNRSNVPITTFHGRLLDVFVPVAQGVLNFINQPAT